MYREPTPIPVIVAANLIAVLIGWIATMVVAYCARPFLALDMFTAKTVAAAFAAIYFAWALVVDIRNRWREV